MKHLSRLACVPVLVSLFCGCAGTPDPAQPRVVQPAAQAEFVRNNAASLLYDLLNEEKNVSKVLLIKRERDELDRLIKTISTVAGDAVKNLEQLAKSDPTLNLKAPALPAGEKATREAISKTKTSQLLGSSGPEFEFQLLLTQVEALSYGSHLARVAGENSANAAQRNEFSRLSVQLRDLFEQSIALLKAPAKRP